MKLSRSSPLRLAAMMAITLLPTVARAQNACLIAWESQFSLSNIFAQARLDQAIETRINASTGALEACPAGDNWSTCWVYRERCAASNFYVNFWPWGSNDKVNFLFNHPQLFNFDCFCNPGDGLGPGRGFKNNGVCNQSSCPNWAAEGRQFAYTTFGNQWIKLWVEQGGDGIHHVFTLYDIVVAGANPIQLWYVKTNGETWGWQQLQNGYHILNATDATSVWIATQETKQPSPFEIEDFIVIPQY